MQRNLRDGQVQQWNAVSPISAHEEHVARSGLSRFEEFAPDGRSQLQRNQSVPGSAAGFFTHLSISAAGQRHYLRVARARELQRAAGAIDRRFANGFTGLASYTFQQTLTDLDSSSVGVAFGAGAGLQTIKDIHANYGPAPFDRPHRLVVSALYQLPFFKERHDVLGKVAGGWQIGAIGTFPGRPVSDAVLVWRPVRRVPRQSSGRPELAAR